MKEVGDSLSQVSQRIKIPVTYLNDVLVLYFIVDYSLFYKHWKPEIYICYGHTLTFVSIVWIHPIRHVLVEVLNHLGQFLHWSVRILTQFVHYGFGVLGYINSHVFAKRLQVVGKLCSKLLGFQADTFDFFTRGCVFLNGGIWNS